MTRTTPDDKESIDGTVAPRERLGPDNHDVHR